MKYMYYIYACKLLVTLVVEVLSTSITYYVLRITLSVLRELLALLATRVVETTSAVINYYEVSYVTIFFIINNNNNIIKKILVSGTRKRSHET